MNNINIIAQYLEKGCKNKQTDDIGIELEHFIVEKGSGRNIPYSGDNGVRKILETISENYEKKVYSEGFLIALSNGRYHLTLEPAAQLEISISPTESIAAAEKIYNEFRGIILPVLDSLGYELLTEGCRRRDRAEDLEIIPKKRYEFMNSYFETSGSCGKNMMRSTASVQVSIDYADEHDCAEKFRTANILAEKNTADVCSERIYGRMWIMTAAELFRARLMMISAFISMRNIFIIHLPYL